MRSVRVIQICRASATPVFALWLCQVQVAAAQSLPDTTTCYRLVYSDEGTNTGVFADYVSIHTAHDRVVRSGVSEASPNDFWSMFLIGGTWTEDSDTLRLHFTNGFSGVSYQLTPAWSDSLKGQMTFLYDVIDQRPPPLRVAAYRLDCSEAHIQSPAYTRRDSEERRLRYVLDSLRTAELDRVRLLNSPLTGTYEFELTVPGQSAVKLYGRTEQHPANPVWTFGDAWNSPPADTLQPYRAKGYQLGMHVAYSSRLLPTTGGANDHGGSCVAYFSVHERPHLVSADSTVWLGRTDVLFASSRCADDEALHATLLQASKAVSDVWYHDAEGDTRGRFVLYVDGEVGVEMEVEQKGRPVLVLHGRRIGVDVVGQPY